MNKPVFRYFQCMIVLGLSIYLADKWTNGQLYYYINMRFALITLIGCLGLAVMAVIGLIPLFTPEQAALSPQSKPQKRKTNLAVIFLLPIAIAVLGLPEPYIWIAFVFVFFIGLMRVSQFQVGQYHLSDIPAVALVILAIPLLLGTFVPVRPLSTSSLSTRGMGLSAPASIGQQSVQTMEIAPDDRTVLDWIKIFNYNTDLSSYLGKSANVIGFVYHDPRLKTGQFMVGRFAITCCVADAFAIGMAVDWPDSTNLVDNSWVDVKGAVDVVTIDGQKVPLIHAQGVNPVQAPDQPYLYP